MDASSRQSRTLTIWRFSDGKAGHDSQSTGLVQALSGLTPCKQLDISVPSFINTLGCMIGVDYRATKHLSDPDLVIGAGHATHFPLLGTQKCRGGKTIVIMQPTLPTNWFDLCLTPVHDHPNSSENIILTYGALNTIKPGNGHRPDKGLILVGGPSKHYSWNSDDILDQIKSLVGTQSLDWALSDSPRTPTETRKALQSLSAGRVHYYPYNSTDKKWLTIQLGIAGSTWVSEDSISMIYEALTSGSAIGLLRVSPKHRGRIQEAIKPLIEKGYLTRFESWRIHRKLVRKNGVFNEADRCARLVLDRFPAASNINRC